MGEWRGEALGREDPDRDVDEELAFHLDGRAAELRAEGIPGDEAIRRALAEFGDVERARRYCRDQDRRRLRRRGAAAALGGLRDDARAALRALLRRPREVLAPGAILALAVGLNALVFTVVRGVLLAPLPFPSAERVYVAEERADNGGISRASYPVLEAWRRGAGVADGVAAYLTGEYVAGLGEAPRHVPGAAVTEGFFGLLDAPVLMGRAFTPADHIPGAPGAILVSEGLWEQAWASDPDVLGRSLRLDGAPYRVVGVVRDGASFPDGAMLWAPLEVTAPGLLPVAGAKILSALVRLRPGVAPAEAARELGALSASVDGGAPSATLTPLADRLRGDVRTPLLLLQAAVLLVLLAACANAGGMLLARSVGRRAEIAVRVSLGAGAGRVARALLAEGLLLGLAAGVVGLALARALLPPALALVPVELPRLSEARIDPALVAIALALAAGTGLVTAFVPAVAGARTAPAGLLREAAGATGSAPWLRRTLEALVVGQVALALTLTAVAGLLVRSFVATVSENPGFDAERLTVMDVSLPAARYPDPTARAALAGELLERARSLPGAQAAALARNLPISGSNMTSPLVVDGSAAQTAAVQIAWVSAGYFEVMGIPLLEGTAFDDAAAGSGPRPLVVDTLVRTAEGSRLRLGDRAHSFFGTQEMGEVVGVAGPVRHAGLRRAPTPLFYEPFFAGEVAPGFTLLVRSTAPAGAVGREAQALLRSLDPDLAADRMGTMASIVGRSVAAPRFYAWVLGAFGIVAVLLAVAGCHAGLSHRVAARRREMGLRIALGASTRSVRGLVVRRGLLLAAAGSALGTAVALPATRLLQSQLYGVGPWDPVAFAAALAILLGAAAAAADAPARRAARVDPIETLRAVPG